MPRCRNCDAYVSDDYVRVLSPDGDTVGACPRCPDMVRTGGTVREARGSRIDARAVDAEALADD